MPTKDSENLAYRSPQESRYRIFKLTRDWLEAFHVSEDAKNMSHSEMVKIALEEVMSGRINEDTIEEMKKALKTNTPKAVEVKDNAKDQPAKSVKPVKAEKKEKKSKASK